VGWIVVVIEHFQTIGIDLGHKIVTGADK